MTSEIFEKTITVEPDHIDIQQHVNNVVYLQWVQDIAGEHWLSKSDPAFNETHFWVVLNHFIEYKGQAFLGDSLTIRTFVERNEGVRSVRIVEIFKADKLITRARTEWVLMNRERNRPVRVPEAVDRLFFGE